MKISYQVKNKIGAKSSPLDSKQAKGPQMHKVLGKEEKERKKIKHGEEENENQSIM